MSCTSRCAETDCLTVQPTVLNIPDCLICLIHQSALQPTVLKFFKDAGGVPMRVSAHQGALQLTVLHASNRLSYISATDWRRCHRLFHMSYSPSLPLSLSRRLTPRCPQACTCTRRQHPAPADHAGRSQPKTPNPDTRNPKL